MTTLVPTRPTWDEYFMEFAELTAKRSSSQKLQVGAVIAKNNRVISTGYNGFLPGLQHESMHRDGREVNTVHAEQNAIADAAKRGVSVANSTMYITHHPCLDCTKLILACGITDIKYLHDYNNDAIARSLCSQSGVQLIRM
jgi:dCMP deaminase